MKISIKNVNQALQDAGLNYEVRPVFTANHWGDRRKAPSGYAVYKKGSMLNSGYYSMLSRLYNRVIVPMIEETKESK